MRKFPLYRWDHELAKSPWAALIILVAFLQAAVLFVVVMGLATNFHAEAVRYALLMAAGYGLLVWISYLVNGAPRYNFVEFAQDSLRIRRYRDLRMFRDEIEEVRPYFLEPGLRWGIILALGMPMPFEKRWIIPPTGGYELLLKKSRSAFRFFPLRVQRIYFAPREREGFDTYLQEWLAIND